MNKDDLLKLLEELDFPKDQFYILSSGCLVFYNLRDMANDLDLCITENLFEQIKNKYDLNAEKKNKYGSIIRDFKVKRGLPKDLVDVKKIDDYLNDKSFDI